MNDYFEDSAVPFGLDLLIAAVGIVGAVVLSFAGVW